MVDLVWWVAGLPFPTIFLASSARRNGAFGLVCRLLTILYQGPDLGTGLPCRTFTNLYHRGEGLGMTEYYVGLELVVGGAVDEGDVVLSFIGQHTGTGREVLGRPTWHFDRVCDLTGTLATGHQVLVGLTRHLWHIQLLGYVL